MHKRIQRRDGSVVLLVPRAESQSVTWMVMFKVGSRQERSDINGVSHFIEHLFFKGTKKRPTTKLLTQEFDRVGAEYNAFTSKDHTFYYIQTAAKHVTLGIDLLSDMLTKALFEKKEMERERGVIVEELNMYRDNPLMRIDEVFENVMFKGMALGMEIGGPREVIKTVSHKKLMAYQKQMYYPGNMVIGVAGNIKEAEVMRLVDRYFPLGKKKDKAKIKREPLRQAAPRALFETKDTDQVQMMLGFPAYERRHKDEYALALCSNILGGTMSSRLFITIRERKGLAYVVRSSVEAYEDAGYLNIHAGLDKKRLAPALSAIKKELNKVVASGVTAKELSDAKENIRGRLTLKFEKPSSYLTSLVSQELLTDSIETLDDILKKVDKVSRADIKRVARQVIQWNKVNLALIGPFSDPKPFLKILTAK